MHQGTQKPTLVGHACPTQHPHRVVAPGSLGYISWLIHQVKKEKKKESNATPRFSHMKLLLDMHLG